VALILNVAGLAQRAGAASGAHRPGLAATAAAPDAAPEADAMVVVFAPPEGGRVAVPLAQIARLEEFPRAALERIGPQAWVQCRGALLPVVPGARLRGDDAAAPAPAADADGSLVVAVHRRGGRDVGLALGRVVDIVTLAPAARAAGPPGGRRVAVALGHATEILDLEAAFARLGDFPDTGPAA
jgi:two-component system chemotaxis sensor kinase CheA